MLRTYEFYAEKPIQFDDERTVGELIQYAFDEFDYYEPFGMDIVTVFQSYHPDTSTGWFTTDKNKKLKDEIVTRDVLCFAYYIPGVFYFAEGGWGHHMRGLGNHPRLENPVALKLRLDDSSNDNTIVFAGNLTMNKIIDAFKRTEYIDKNLTEIKIYIFCRMYAYERIYSLSDSIMDLPLTEFEKLLPNELHRICLY